MTNPTIGCPAPGGFPLEPGDPNGTEPCDVPGCARSATCVVDVAMGYDGGTYETCRAHALLSLRMGGKRWLLDNAGPGR